MSKKRAGALGSVYNAQAIKDGTAVGAPPLPAGSKLEDFDGIMDGQWVTADFWILDLGAHTLLQPVSQLGLLWAQEQFGFRRERDLHPRLRRQRLRNFKIDDDEDARAIQRVLQQRGILGPGDVPDDAGRNFVGDVSTFGNVLVLDRKASTEYLKRIEAAGLTALQWN
jgi:hypothetical protein